ncbi:MAG: hypothetical protein U0Z53_01945 [Blastocatellia bacterium]
MNASNCKTRCLAITALLLSAVIVTAQDPAQLKEMFARARQQNAQALKQYTWKSRNEVRKNGDSKNTQVFLMSYDARGNLQKSQIGGSAPQPMPKGPLMASIAQKKKEELMTLINALREQTQAYSHLPPEKMQAFLAGATISARLDQGLVQIQSGNILQRGDSMSIWLDARTRKQRRVEINTFLDQQPVKAVIEFSDLPDGPTYMARTVVDYPKEALQLITENFDYERGR